MTTVGWEKLGQIIAATEQHKHVYDVVIVGAGLSGLMAAYALRDRDVLVLEREPRAGGRILTRSAHGVSYDLGAIFGYNQQVLPFDPGSTTLISESERIGVGWQGQVFYGTSVMECLSKLDLSDEDYDAIQRFSEDPTRAAHTLPDHVYALLEAFFQVIHPGDMRDYLAQRQRDAFQKFSMTHYESGNGVLIEQFERRLGAKLRMDAEVLSVTDETDRVRVVVNHQGEREALLARSVIVTTPAMVALKLLTSVSDHCRAFLRSVQYRGGTVVAIGVQGGSLADFSCIVTPDEPTSTIIQHHTGDPHIQVLLVYYAGKKSADLEPLSEAEVSERTFEVLRRLHICPDLEHHVLFVDRHHWPIVGPVIATESYTWWDEPLARPSQRVFLAGEYVYVCLEEVLPYGTGPALLSGERAAHKVRQFLTHPVPFDTFKSTMLVEVTRYEMTPERPVFVGRTEEGNIAYYGLVLQANPNEHLKEYLLHHSRDLLWEYHIGFGVTAEDSALVIEGLLVAGVRREFLRPSMQRLVERFYLPEPGAFQTVLKGRASYWTGPSVDATGHLGYLLHGIAPEEYAREIEACARYLQRTQEEAGTWQGRWFPSVMITTFYAVRLLCLFKHAYLEAIRRASSAILAAQEDNGSWSHSVIETSAAMLALAAAGLKTPAQDRARTWLLSQKRAHGWRGEPVLFYWFKMEEGQRTFFDHCTDKGSITTAWATLALKT